jgi:alpha-L-fucosidase
MEFSRGGFLLGSAAGAALAIGGEVSAWARVSTQPGARTFDVPPSALHRWRDARFGMFLHWGLYSILGRGEWVLFNEQIDCREYRRLMDRFNPTEFDAEAWAGTAKAAGMKYMVLTSRHCDGFCLWDSYVSDFTSTHSAAQRDFVAEYKRAGRKAGLLVGLYYSPAD